MRSMLGVGPKTLTGLLALVVACAAIGCGDDPPPGPPPGTGATTAVGAFDGLFDDVVDGYNFPLDIAIVPEHVERQGSSIEYGDVLTANYGTSEVLLARNPSGSSANSTADAFYDGTASGLSGATAVAMAPDGTVWAAFEQGGDGNDGGVAILDPDGTEIALLDGASHPGAFARPGGLCYGDMTSDESLTWFFLVNMEDGTAWRIDASNWQGDDAEVTQVGSGLATGSAGNPGSPDSGLTSSNDLPEGGARGCAFHGGHLYVADGQNARVVRFDDADVGEDIDPVALEDTPPELVTYPTGVTVNNEGNLIVISYDNAHAFVALDLPGGGFLDNGLYDLNVNSGNHGTQVAADTIWFTRANNSNGSLRAITRDQQHPPSTDGPFPVQ